MSVYVVRTLLSNSVYYSLANSAVTDIAESERLGDRIMFTVYPTPYTSSVQKVSLIIRPATACELCCA